MGPPHRGFLTFILLDPDGLVVEIGGSITEMMPRLERLVEKREQMPSRRREP